MAVLRFEVPDDLFPGRYPSPEAFGCALRLAAAI